MIRHHPLAMFFVLAFGISWLLWAPLWLPAFGVTSLPVLPLHHALGAVGPITAAFLVSWQRMGLAGSADLFRRMGLWRGQLRWIAVALLGPFVLFGLALLLVTFISGESLSLTGFGRSREFPQWSVLGFLTYNIVSFGYGEEVGWRGFALPHLQTRYSAFVATFLLTCGWALWHLPLFFYRPGYMSMQAADIVGWFFSILTGAILLTWLYNESHGSLLVVALFHAAIDIVFTSDISSQAVVTTSGVLVTFWGIIVLLITGPATLSRRGKKMTCGEEYAATDSPP